MNEDEKNFWDLAGGEAGARFLGGFIRTFEEQKSAVIARMQKAQGETERATAESAAEKVQLDKSIAAGKKELAELDSKRGQVKDALAVLQREHEEMAKRVSSLRAEASRYRRAILDIEEDEPKIQ